MTIGLPRGSAVKKLPAMQELQETQVRSLHQGRSPGGGHGNPLQFSCLEKSHRQRSLPGYGPLGLRESGMTEVT